MIIGLARRRRRGPGRRGAAISCFLKSRDKVSVEFTQVCWWFFPGGDQIVLLVSLACAVGRAFSQARHGGSDISLNRTDLTLLWVS